MSAAQRSPGQRFTLADFEPEWDSLEDARAHRRRRLAVAYRVFGALRWGSVGDGHISARDPLLTDHYWLARYGVPFNRVTEDDLVLVRPDGRTIDGEARAINPAAHCIHWPVHEARPDVVSAAHTHTPYGTAFAATCRTVEPISQESCAFVDDHAVFDDEALDITTLEEGARIAAALGPARAVSLRNHGHLTVGGSIDEAVGWFVMFERVAEVHIKAGPMAQPISTAGALSTKRSMGRPVDGWHAFRWVESTVLN